VNVIDHEEVFYEVLATILARDREPSLQEFGEK